MTPKVPATAPIRRFEPNLAPWCGHTIDFRGETAWAIEALHLNRERRLYMSDISGHTQSERLRLYRAKAREKKAGDGGGGCDSTAASGPGGAAGGQRRSRGGRWQGLHMHRTCRLLEKQRLAAWPDDDDDGGGGVGGCDGDEGTDAGTTVEALLPGGGSIVVERDAAARRVTGAGQWTGRRPSVRLPRLTAAGRIVWMQVRLGLTPRETIALALLWGRYRQAGYFIKSFDIVRENVWVTDTQVNRAYNALGRKGYIEAGLRLGHLMHVQRADEIEPYGPMLEAIESMVYGARAGEYVYGETYDDEIDRAYAAAVEALGEGEKNGKGRGRGGRDGGMCGGRAA